MAKRRLGVVLLVPEPLATEINGLRRGLGDPALERIAPHITLVPPVNIREDDLELALGRVRDGAASAPSPLHLTLGPIASFLPHNPVLILTVSGDLVELRALREAVFVEPLARPLSWPFVPHVTVADGVEPARIGAAMTALDRYATVAVIDRIHVLEERREPPVGRQGQRRWFPIADAVFGPRAVVGRGGINLGLSRSTLLDPGVVEMLAAAPADRPALTGHSGTGVAGSIRSVVVTARQGVSAVGVGSAWYQDGRKHIGIFVTPTERGQGFGGHLLAAVEAATVDEGWSDGPFLAHGPARFYEARSARSRVAGPGL